MKKNSVKVYHTKPTAWYSDVEYDIKDLFEKFGDILIDWKITCNKCGEFIIWYILKDTDSVPNEPKIKI